MEAAWSQVSLVPRLHRSGAVTFTFIRRASTPTSLEPNDNWGREENDWAEESITVYPVETRGTVQLCKLQVGFKAKYLFLWRAYWGYVIRLREMRKGLALSFSPASSLATLPCDHSACLLAIPQHLLWSHLRDPAPFSAWNILSSAVLTHSLTSFGSFLKCHVMKEAFLDDLT